LRVAAQGSSGCCILELGGRSEAGIWGWRNARVLGCSEATLSSVAEMAMATMRVSAVSDCAAAASLASNSPTSTPPCRNNVRGETVSFQTNFLNVSESFGIFGIFEKFRLWCFRSTQMLTDGAPECLVPRNLMCSECSEAVVGWVGCRIWILECWPGYLIVYD